MPTVNPTSNIYADVDEYMLPDPDHPYIDVLPSEESPVTVCVDLHPNQDANMSPSSSHDMTLDEDFYSVIPDENFHSMKQLSKDIHINPSVHIMGRTFSGNRRSTSIRHVAMRRVVSL